ncbi:MFS transporter [Jannaschia sp. Os4]|uniref:MFS transporter n=1 Tax=Jannaschia sp. Os4 TaxID=2807617 RepID=UPI001939892F|nr:MFS transporter [Jannaschia sp. Os4]MBM2574997.1 MFS transporter [Jannaschia sp. Os4]
MAQSLPLPCADGRPSDGTCPDTTGTLIATTLGSALAFIVGSIVNVALPAMQETYAAGPTGAQWIVNAYLLPLGALVLIGGALGDHYGRRRVFLAGLVVFTVACGICAVAPTFPILMAGRALEGVGAALVAPTSLAIISDAFDGKARGKAIGTWAGAGAAASALAPVAGGWIVDVAGWRWAFVAVIPLAVAAFWFALRSVRESTADRGERAALDWTGAALVSAALGAGIWGLVALPERGATPLVLGALVAGAALFAAFLWIERTKGDGAMIPLALFRDGTFSGLSLYTFLLYAALGGLLLLLPYVMIQDLGWSATAAGTALLPFPLIMGLASRFVGGTLADRLGARILLTAGAALVALAFGLWTFTPAEGVDYRVHILPGLLVMAVGMSLAVAPLTSTVLAAAGDDYSGVASGVNNAISRVGGLVATALLGLVLLGQAESLTAGFALAAMAGAALAAGSAALSWLLVRPRTS